MAYINGKEVLFDPYISINGAQTPTQAKTVDITKNGKTEVLPDTGYALSKVTVNTEVESAKPEQIKILTITENGTTEAVPDNGYVLSKVIVNTNVESKGAELNIAYGDTPPEDTTKLWVKTSEPSEVIMTDKMITAESEGISGEITDITMPETCRLFGVGCLVDDKMYYLGGTSKPSNYYQPVSTNYVFDFATLTFSPISVSFNRAECGYAVVGRKIYLMGGWIPSGSSSSAGTRLNTINVYDVDSGELTTLNTTLPYTQKPYTVAVGTDIFGISIYDATYYFWKYDTVNDTITTLDLAHSPYYDISMVTDGKRYVYVVGGRNGTKYTDNIYRYDTVDNQWAILTPKLSYPRRPFASVMVDNKIYVIGGQGASIVNTLDIIDLENNTTETYQLVDIWVDDPYFYGNHSLPIVYGGIIYLFGGFNTNLVQSNSWKNNVHTIKSTTSEYILEDGMLQIVTSTQNKFLLINNDTAKVEIGVKKAYKGNSEGKGEQVEALLYKNDTWTAI